VGASVVVKVEDTGMGISPELLPRVFDLFVQARQTLARSQGGLGLGLTIASSLVTLHGGSVSAESAGLGKGSRFTVRLPALELGSRASRHEAGRVSEVKVTPLRVLVVDDNQDAAEMLSEALQLLGYRTAAAHDGPEALRVAEEFQPDAVLLDIGLPVMDGYELAQRLRAQFGPELTLVAITGYGQETDRLRSQAAGCQDHFTKPVDLDKLAKKLSSLSPRCMQVAD
jgi:CheY-like chemotaxis protein